MSRSNNTNVVNPAVRFFDWSGAEGTLSYYDKEAKVKVNVKLPFTFIVLDTLSTIKGYSQADEVGIYSNEIRSTNEDILHVKTFKGVTVAKGIYKEIKDTIVGQGGKFAQSCYIAFFDDNKVLQIGNITFTASSLGGGENKKEGYEVGAWIGFTKANKANIMKGAIVMEKDERVCVNGATKFFCPKFKIKEISDETNKKAFDLDVELQGYLETYLKSPKPSDEAEKTSSDIETKSGDDMVNFEPKDKTKTEQPHIIGENEDDLPF